MPYHFQEMRDLLPPNPRIFDIGANIGEKTEHYLSLHASHIVSLEPNPDCVNILNDKFKDFSNVFIVPQCVSSAKGTIDFFLAENHSDLSTADEDWKAGQSFKSYTWGQAIKVSTTTLDELTNAYGMPDFCKIDVEGFELNVLKGMTKPISFLSFEFAYEFLDRKTKPCLDYLYGLGYRSFNLALKETEEFIKKSEWMNLETLFAFLKNYPDQVCWGDIYARI